MSYMSFESGCFLLYLKLTEVWLHVISFDLLIRQEDITSSFMVIINITYQEEKGTTEKAMVGWHHWFNEFEQALGDGEGQGNLACCSPWGCRVRHNWATEHQCLPSCFNNFWYFARFVSSVLSFTVFFLLKYFKVIPDIIKI